MHELTIIIVLLLIIGVLLDGIRRMRQSRRNSSQMNLGMDRDVTHEDEPSYSSELPSGGARVIDRKQQKNTDEVNSSPVVSKPSPTQQETLNLEESVPMLMDSVASIEANPYAPNNTDGSDDKENNSDPQKQLSDPISDPISEPIPQSIAEADPNNSLDSPNDKRIEPKLGRVPNLDENPVGEEPEKDTRQSNKKQPPSNLHDQPRELLVIHIEAASGNYFQGEDLLKLILDQGLRYGAMNIFHRHVSEDGEGTILFSMSNMVMPGTFDLATIEALSTPGVSLFLSLPMADYNSMDAFDKMLATAKTIADKFNGQVNDDQHSVMTRQTTEHYRERIGNFLRKQRLREKAQR